jgi:hypothetical protein
MKTPLQELFEYESDLTNMFDSDVRVAGALLEYIRTNKKDMLETEKDMMCYFAYECRNIMAADAFAITHWHDKTFNPKEI